MMKSAKLFAIVGLVMLSMSTLCHGQQLRVGFYKGKCGTKDVESIIRGIVAARFLRDPSIVAALLRMYFHDCFVNGCDASLLLDGSSSEKTAGPNFSVRGYDLIDQIKAAVEKACQGVVSCADIIAAATRDAVALGGGIRYALPMGRRDGNESLAGKVNLPGPSISVAQSISVFRNKGLNVSDMVLLLGGHTVGITHCSFVNDRLYNFRGTGRPDPSMNTTLAAMLMLNCPKNSPADNPVNLDQNMFSANVVDNSFYRQIVARRGVLEIDQNLALDRATRSMVSDLANSTSFGAQFANALVKMGGIGVLTGTKGEIRRSCRRTNRR